jgi:hypothetical protein
LSMLYGKHRACYCKKPTKCHSKPCNMDC